MQILENEENLEEERKTKKKRCLIWVCVIFVLFAIAGAIVGILYGVGCIKIGQTTGGKI